MNKVILIGRLARDPQVSYSSNSNAVARFTIAVDRRFKREGEAEAGADFISCVAFGKTGEFLEKYGKKGTKFVVEGRIQTGSYTNREGQKVYTTDVVVENVEFAESKSGQSDSDMGGGFGGPSGQPDGGFMNLPDGVDEELPFN